MVEMKDSNIEWIGNIPKHWGICKVKNGFYQKKSKACQEEPVVLSLARAGVKVRDITTNEGQLASSYYEYNPVTINDILINPMDLVSGANCSLSKVEGVISPAYINLRYKIGYNPQYYNYYFKYQYWSKAFFTYGKGVSFDNRWTINNETLMRFPLLHPPLYEQNKIAEFLDEKCAEIDSISAEIQEQINTLEEYKKSVITEAVTKGLNPNVEMKDSGIEWIGQIPNNWDMKRTKYVSISFSKGNGITKEDVDSDGDIQCIRYGEIYSKYNIMFKNCISATNLNKISSPKYIANGDILFAGTGELVEEIGKNIVYIGNKPCLAGGDIIILKHNQNPGFLNYVLCSQYAQIQKSLGKAKLKVVHISAFDIGNVRIALPPIEEQKKIADYLDSKCLEIDGAIEDKQKQLEILDEYKKTIIYEYVTGKKEVV